MSLHSMTAYGYGEHEGEGLCYTAELRTLNSRYLEVSVRLPRHLLALEVEIINHVKGRLKRGKVDVFIDTVRAGSAREMPQLDPDAVRHYLALYREISSLVMGAGGAPPAEPAFADLLRLDGVLQSDKVKTRGVDAAEAHKAGIFKALDKALDALVRSMSPFARSATTFGRGLPRLGTSCHSNPLALDRSTGLVSTKLAT